MTDSFFEICLIVPREHSSVFAETIEPHVGSISWNAGIEFDKVELKALSNIEPDINAINMALYEVSDVFDMPPPHLFVSQVKSRDWITESLRNFLPHTIGQFYIRSISSPDAVPYSKINLNIPAGLAFGTGSHGSTKGCLIALGKIAYLRGPKQIGLALDMGSGSGILSIAIAKLFHTKVRAVDIDSKAIQVCRENIKKNGVNSFINICLGDSKHRKVRESKYDLIVANILTRPLALMAKDINYHLNPGGLVILSGFLTIDVNRMISTYTTWNMSYLSRITVDGWETIIFRKAYKK